MTTWNAPIYVYLWLAGMAGGSYFAAFLADRFAGYDHKRLTQLAIQMGVLPAVLGVLLLLADLGNPLRFWHLLAEFKILSPMSMGTWILLAWVAIAVIMNILYRYEGHHPEPRVQAIHKLNSGLGGLEFGVSVLLMSYTGVLLATSNRTLWAGSALIPPLFVASAVSTGIAVLIAYILVVAPVTIGRTAEYRLPARLLTGSVDWAIPTRLVGRLWEAEAVVILVELVVLIGLVTWLGSSAMAGAREALNQLTFGALAVPFWVGVVLLASIVPLAFDMMSPGKELHRREVFRVALASSVCVLLGALFLRAVIVIGGQI